MSSLNLTVNSEREMEALGEKIALALRPNDTVYLVGELGAGKTTLVRGIARGLGYQGRVTSPSFTLINIYQALVPLYHCDFYRLRREDTGDLGLEEFLERDGIAVVEWPERLGEALPSRALVIEILLTDGDYDLPRQVTIKGRGKRYVDRVEELKAVVSAGNR